MGTLGVLEPQRVGERVKDSVGGAGGVAALHALVVLDAHAGQRGDLLAPQPRARGAGHSSAGRPERA